MPQQRKKKERSERLRGESDQIKFIDLGFERWQVVRFRKLFNEIESHQTKLTNFSSPNATSFLTSWGL